MSLYNLKKEAEEIIERMLSSVDMDTGELLDEAKYLSAQGELAEVENLANESMEWILQKRQNIEAEIGSIDTEIERLSARKKSLSKKSDGLTGYIAYFFKSLYQWKTMNFGMFSIGYRKSTAVNVLDAALIPSEYMRQAPTPPPAPDKTAIKDALKEGKQIAGVELEERENIFIK